MSGRPMRKSLPAVVLGVLLLAGCRKGATPTPLPPITPPPTRVVEATVSQVDWRLHETSDFAISLPPGWSVLTFADENYEQLFQDFSASNPTLAAQLGGADALKGVELWAFDQEGSQTDFVDNLNIRRSPTDGQAVGPLEGVLSGIEEQYKVLGWPVSEVRAGLTIGDLPAGMIAYQLPMIDRNNAPIQAAGRQYILSAEDALWILSFTSSPLQRAQQTAVTAQIANSFRLR